MTQEALARAADLSLHALSKIETRGTDPKWSTVVRLARALGASLGDFDPSEAKTPGQKAGKRKKAKRK